MFHSDSHPGPAAHHSANCSRCRSDHRTDHCTSRNGSSHGCRHGDYGRDSYGSSDRCCDSYCSGYRCSHFVYAIDRNCGDAAFQPILRQRKDRSAAA